MMNKRVYLTMIVTSLLMLLNACGSDDDKVTDAKQAKQEKLKQVLVKVNGTKITNYDLELALTTLVGEQQAQLIDSNGRKKALESIVMSRVISQAAEKELSDDDQEKLEKRLAAHREKLLVNYYLRKHSDIGPVTNEMVKEYYDKHPERFGAKKVRIYEMIFGDKKIDLAQREQVIRSLKSADQKKDWQAQVKNLRDKGFALQYRKGSSDNAILQSRIRSLIDSTPVGKTSQLTFLQGKPYIVRVVEEKQSTAKPLRQVSGDIRKILAPVQMKKAIEKVSDNLMKTANIEYKDK